MASAASLGISSRPCSPRKSYLRPTHPRPRPHRHLLTSTLSDYIAHLDGYSVISGGWLNHHWIQLGYQLADSFAGGAYSFVGTCVILAALDSLGKFVPALRLRATEEEEALGIDDVEIGEFAVCFSLPRIGIGDVD
jgi:hypothetical protein